MNKRMNGSQDEYKDRDRSNDWVYITDPLDTDGTPSDMNDVDKREIHKSIDDRLQECVQLRTRIRITGLTSFSDNDDKLKVAMNAFVKNGTPCTLRMWTDSSLTERAVVTLTPNANKPSGITFDG
jgi:hypothetical protein